jgi:hypothetical protein
MVEDFLRETAAGDPSAAPKPQVKFSERWGGKLELNRKDEARFQHLSEKYGL